MFYEINVSKDGRHYFATHERSLIGKVEALKAYHDFVKRFPASEGFYVTLTECRRSGKDITPVK
jgi:hypothetical protein